MKYGYAKKTTDDQDLKLQLDQLKREDCTNVFVEELTGTKRDRPEFNKILKTLKEGDTLVITNLNSFAYSTQDGIVTIRKLFESGVKVHVLNMGLVEDTQTGKLIFNIMLKFAEFEKDMIAERIEERRAIVRLDLDFKEGVHKKYSRKQINHAIQLRKTNTYEQVEDITGISKGTLIRARRRLGLGRKGLI